MNMKKLTTIILLFFSICSVGQELKTNEEISLHSAARYNNHYSELALLINNGGDVNLLDSEGNTPLYVVLLYNSFSNEPSYNKERIKKAELLINNGANVNIKGSALPILFYSVENYGMLKLLVEAGANVNEKNNLNHLMARGGDSPLHWASQYGTLKEVLYLLENGAEINAEDDCGWTPLHCAIFSGNIEVVNFYLSKEMDRTIRTTKEFEVLWGGEAENPYPVNSTLLQIAKIAQSNAHRYEKESSDYDEIIRLLEEE
jgi:ankyrin repeat protein